MFLLQGFAINILSNNLSLDKWTLFRDSPQLSLGKSPTQVYSASVIMLIVSKNETVEDHHFLFDTFGHVLE